MADFYGISVAQAREMLAGAAILLDIRDGQSFVQGHVSQAQNLTSERLHDFISTTPRHTLLLVLCYHGINSQAVAAYLAGQQFTQVYSVEGGMEAWRQQYPQDVQSAMMR